VLAFLGTTPADRKADFTAARHNNGCVRDLGKVQSYAANIGDCGMARATYLSAQLREAAPYLCDAGWRQTADLLIAAALEIEQLRAQIALSRAMDEPLHQANENAYRVVRKA
jgi:hypothetical protein